jgi:E3 ubiquitin-protein ligase UBR4
LKPQQEKEAACISIWHRLINTLVENVCNPPNTFEVENEGEYHSVYFVGLFG